MKTNISMEDIKSLRAQTGVGLTKCKEALEASEGDLEKAVLYLRKLGLASAGKKESRETKEGLIGAWADGKGFSLIEVNVETDFVANNDVFRGFVQSLVETLHDFAGDDLEKFLTLPYPKDPSVTVDQQRAVVMQTVGENIRINKIAFRSSSNEEKESCGIYSHGNGKNVAVVVIKGCDKCEALAKDIAMHVVASSPDYICRADVPSEIIEREKEVIASQTQGKPQAVVDKIVEGKLSNFYKEVCLLEQPFVKNPDKTVGQLLEEQGKASGTSLTLTYFSNWKIGA
ncbi:translation elongation factor Ts [Chlamydiifrater phoenicopteri]|uniref:translation elongation factor Ts n=1 Tax=Chlamydiifrater phoenicopteri TaxID=2681469 RepID=UPI001FE73932|nr:translation elongation factor Ts [Chlamydiifrater phoenicopteri]